MQRKYADNRAMVCMNENRVSPTPWMKTKGGPLPQLRNGIRYLGVSQTPEIPSRQNRARTSANPQEPWRGQVEHSGAPGPGHSVSFAWLQRELSSIYSYIRDRGQKKTRT